MIAPAIPPNEAQRLKALRDYDILDSQIEKSFDDLTQLASDMFGAPVSKIAFIDENRQWFKSAVGGPLGESSRDISFCGHAILEEETFVVEDARMDERFFDNPFVTANPSIVFYAGAPIISPGGHALGTLCVTDFKARRFSDRERRSLEALARQVMTLLEFRKKVELLDRSISDAWQAYNVKSDFLAGVSHEIRTPMNGIVGLTDLLLIDDNMNFEQKAQLKLIQNCSYSLLELVDDILDLSKLEAQKIEIEANAFCLKQVLHETVMLYQPTASKKNISLKLAIPDETPDQLIGDSHRIRQVLNNLISNAIKFQSHGEISIELSGVSNGEGAFHGKIDIIDQGIGIEKANIAKLFKSYSQAEASTSRKFGGTGLGLAIAYNLSLLMGGSIAVKSEYGVGSTFSFCFKSEIAKPAELDRTTVDKNEVDLDLTLRILVADDSSINQKVIRAMLARLGFTPEVVQDGRGIIEALNESQFDIIFMDCLMPNLSGFEATKLIRKKTDLGVQPEIIALTASPRVEDQMAARAAGMDDYLTKPVSIDKLRNAIAVASQRLAKRQRAKAAG